MKRFAGLLIVIAVVVAMTWLLAIPPALAPWLGSIAGVIYAMLTMPRRKQPE